MAAGYYVPHNLATVSETDNILDRRVPLKDAWARIEAYEAYGRARRCMDAHAS